MNKQGHSFLLLFLSILIALCSSQVAGNSKPEMSHRLGERNLVEIEAPSEVLNTCTHKNQNSDDQVEIDKCKILTSKETCQAEGQDCLPVLETEKMQCQGYDSQSFGKTLIECDHLCKQEPTCIKFHYWEDGTCSLQSTCSSTTARPNCSIFTKSTCDRALYPSWIHSGNQYRSSTSKTKAVNARTQDTCKAACLGEHSMTCKSADLCNEVLRGTKDADYRGCQSKTRSGKTCQAWDMQSPHKHGKEISQAQGNIGNNFCRNPDGAETIWCFTTDPDTRWEYCDPIPVCPVGYSCQTSPKGIVYKEFLNKDCPSNDFTVGEEVNLNIENCQAFCDSEPTCLSYTFNPDTIKCWAKKVCNIHTMIQKPGTTYIKVYPQTEDKCAARTTTDLIKAQWKCVASDNVKLISSKTGKTKDECEQLCIDQLNEGCAWFNHDSTTQTCETFIDGCEATAIEDSGFSSYRPKTFLQSACYDSCILKDERSLDAGIPRQGGTDVCAEFPLKKMTLIKENWVCGDSNKLRLKQETGVTLEQCHLLCQANPLCFWIQYNSAGQDCSLKGDGCEATEKTTTYSDNSYRPTGYIPKGCNAKGNFQLDVANCQQTPSFKVKIKGSLCTEWEVSIINPTLQVQTPETCNSACQNSLECNEFVFNNNLNSCTLQKGPCTKYEKTDNDLYIISTTKPSTEPATCSHLVIFGTDNTVIEKCKAIKTKETCLPESCGWIKVRHLSAEPKGVCFNSDDQMAGTDVWGNENDDSKQWGIKFDTTPYDEIMFQTNDKLKYIIFKKEELLGSRYDAAYKNFVRSNQSPEKEGIGSSKMYYREGLPSDPHVMIGDERIYCATNAQALPLMPLLQVGGLSIWIRQSNTNPKETCLKPVEDTKDCQWTQGWVAHATNKQCFSDRLLQSLKDKIYKDEECDRACYEHQECLYFQVYQGADISGQCDLFIDCPEETQAVSSNTQVYKPTPHVKPSEASSVCDHKPIYNADEAARVVCAGITDKSLCNQNVRCQFSKTFNYLGNLGCSNYQTQLIKSLNDKTYTTEECDQQCLEINDCAEFELVTSGIRKGQCVLNKIGCTREENFEIRTYTSSPKTVPKATINTCTHQKKFNSNSNKVLHDICSSKTSIRECPVAIEKSVFPILRNTGCSNSDLANSITGTHTPESCNQLCLDKLYCKTFILKEGNCYLRKDDCNVNLDTIPTQYAVTKGPVIHLENGGCTQPAFKQFNDKQYTSDECNILCLLEPTCKVFGLTEEKYCHSFEQCDFITGDLIKKKMFKPRADFCTWNQPFSQVQTNKGCQNFDDVKLGTVSNSVYDPAQCYRLCAMRSECAFFETKNGGTLCNFVKSECTYGENVYTPNDAWYKIDTVSSQPSSTPETCTHKPYFNVDPQVINECQGITEKNACLSKYETNDYILYESAESISWDDSYKYAQSQGGRLATIEEVRAIMAKNIEEPAYDSATWNVLPIKDYSQLIINAQCVGCYVAVGTPSSKDFIRIGHWEFGFFPGQAVVDGGSPYPPWGDTSGSTDEIHHTAVLYFPDKCQWNPPVPQIYLADTNCIPDYEAFLQIGAIVEGQSVIQCGSLCDNTPTCQMFRLGKGTQASKCQLFKGTCQGDQTKATADWDLYKPVKPSIRMNDGTWWKKLEGTSLLFTSPVIVNSVIDEQKCAQECLDANTFDESKRCLSFNYESTTQKCTLIPRTGSMPFENQFETKTGVNYFWLDQFFKPASTENDICTFLDNKKQFLQTQWKARSQQQSSLKISSLTAIGSKLECQAKCEEDSTCVEFEFSTKTCDLYKASILKSQTGVSGSRDIGSTSFLEDPFGSATYSKYQSHQNPASQSYCSVFAKEPCNADDFCSWNTNTQLYALKHTDSECGLDFGAFAVEWESAFNEELTVSQCADKCASKYYANCKNFLHSAKDGSCKLYPGFCSKKTVAGSGLNIYDILNYNYENKFLDKPVIYSGCDPLSSKYSNSVKQLTSALNICKEKCQINGSNCQNFAAKDVGLCNLWKYPCSYQESTQQEGKIVYERKPECRNFFEEAKCSADATCVWSSDECLTVETINESKFKQIKWRFLSALSTLQVETGFTVQQCANLCTELSEKCISFNYGFRSQDADNHLKCETFEFKYGDANTVLKTSYGQTDSKIYYELISTPPRTMKNFCTHISSQNSVVPSIMECKAQKTKEGCLAVADGKCTFDEEITTFDDGSTWIKKTDTMISGTPDLDKSSEASASATACATEFHKTTNLYVAFEYSASRCYLWLKSIYASTGIDLEVKMQNDLYHFISIPQSDIDNTCTHKIAEIKVPSSIRGCREHSNKDSCLADSKCYYNGEQKNSCVQTKNVVGDIYQMPEMIVSPNKKHFTIEEIIPFTQDCIYERSSYKSGDCGGSSIQSKGKLEGLSSAECIQSGQADSTVQSVFTTRDYTATVKWALSYCVEDGSGEWIGGNKLKEIQGESLDQCKASCFAETTCIEFSYSDNPTYITCRLYKAACGQSPTANGWNHYTLQRTPDTVCWLFEQIDKACLPPEQIDRYDTFIFKNKMTIDAGGEQQPTEDDFSTLLKLYMVDVSQSKDILLKLRHHFLDNSSLIREAKGYSFFVETQTIVKIQTTDFLCGDEVVKIENPDIFFAKDPQHQVELLSLTEMFGITSSNTDCIIKYVFSKTGTNLAINLENMEGYFDKSKEAKYVFELRAFSISGVSTGMVKSSVTICGYETIVASTTKITKSVIQREAISITAADVASLFIIDATGAQTNPNCGLDVKYELYKNSKPYTGFEIKLNLDNSITVETKYRLIEILQIKATTIGLVSVFSTEMSIAVGIVPCADNIYPLNINPETPLLDLRFDVSELPKTISLSPFILPSLDQHVDFDIENFSYKEADESKVSELTPYSQIEECECENHPENLLEDKGALALEECGTECRNEPTCVIFVHGPSHCQLYSQDCQCKFNDKQIKYSITREYSEYWNKVIGVFAPSNNDFLQENNQNLICNERLLGNKNNGYRGCQTKTRSGRTCQAWKEQKPHVHALQINSEFGLDGDHNYCRNPNSGGDTIWCYTTDLNSRWELCDPVNPSIEIRTICDPLGYKPGLCSNNDFVRPQTEISVKIQTNCYYVNPTTKERIDPKLDISMKLQTYDCKSNMIDVNPGQKTNSIKDLHTPNAGQLFKFIMKPYISDQKRYWKAPEKLLGGVHCDFSRTPGGSSNRISMNSPRSIESCDTLCHNTPGCVQFHVGQGTAYRNRCDLFKTTTCKWMTAHNFGIYQPSQPKIITYELTDFIDFKSNMNGCFPNEFKRCSDTTCVQPYKVTSATNVNLKVGTFSRNALDGIPKSQFEINVSKVYSEKVIMEVKETISGLVSVQEGLIIVCGQEEIILKETDQNKQTVVMSYFADQITKPMSFPLLDYFDVDITGSLQSPGDCPIIEYKICSDIKCQSLIQAHPNLKIEGSILKLDILPIPQEYVYIEAKTVGMKTKMLEIDLKICGFEKITSLVANPYQLEQKVKDGLIFMDLNSFFSNDKSEACPITSILLMSDKAGVSPFANNIFKLNSDDNTLEISPNNPAIFTFFVKAETEAKIRNVVQVDITITKEENAQAFFVVNEVNEKPVLNGLDAGVSIVATKLADGSFEDETAFVYTSPLATDPEEDPIKLDFSGIEDAPFIIVEQSPELPEFSISVDRTLIDETSIGTYILEIGVSDEQVSNDERNTYKMNIEIDFVQIVAEETKEASSEESSSSSGPVGSTGEVGEVGEGAKEKQDSSELTGVFIPPPFIPSLIEEPSLYLPGEELSEEQIAAVDEKVGETLAMLDDALGSFGEEEEEGEEIIDSDNVQESNSTASNNSTEESADDEASLEGEGSTSNSTSDSDSTDSTSNSDSNSSSTSNDTTSEKSSSSNTASKSSEKKSTNKPSSSASQKTATTQRKSQNSNSNSAKFVPPVVQKKVVVKEKPAGAKPGGWFKKNLSNFKTKLKKFGGDWMTFVAKMTPVGEVELKPDDFPILGCWIKSLDTLGKVTLQFNVTLVPELIYKPDLERLLSFEITPEDDGSDEDRGSKLQFDWEVTGFSKEDSTIDFQLDFQNAAWISAGEVEDQLSVIVLNKKYFQPKVHRLLAENQDHKKPVKQALETGVLLKRQMPNDEESKKLAKNTSNANSGFSFSTVVFFVLQSYMLTVFKKVLGTLLALQIVVHLGMINVKIPAAVTTFMATMKQVTYFNVLNFLAVGNEIVFSFDYQEQASLKEEHLSVSLKALGFKYMNCILNLNNAGQMLFYNLFLVFCFGVYYVIFYFNGSNQSHQRASKLRDELFWSPFLNMSFRLFIPFSIASYLNIMHSTQPHEDHPGHSGENIGNIYAYVVAFIVGIFFPAMMLFVALVPQKQLEDRHFKKQFGFLYASIKTENYWQRFYYFVFISRRAVLVYVGLFMSAHPAIQLQIVMLNNTFLLIYVAFALPFNTRYDNRMELNTEFFVGVITFHLVAYTDFVQDKDTQVWSGMSFIYFTCLLLAINMYFILIDLKRNLRRQALRFVNVTYYQWRHPPRKPTLIDLQEEERQRVNAGIATFYKSMAKKHKLQLLKEKNKNLKQTFRKKLLRAPSVVVRIGVSELQYINQKSLSIELDNIDGSKSIVLPVSQQRGVSKPRAARTRKRPEKTKFKYLQNLTVIAEERDDCPSVNTSSRSDMSPNASNSSIHLDIYGGAEAQAAKNTVVLNTMKEKIQNVPQMIKKQEKALETHLETNSKMIEQLMYFQKQFEDQK